MQSPWSGIPLGTPPSLEAGPCLLCPTPWSWISLLWGSTPYYSWWATSFLLVGLLKGESLADGRGWYLWSHILMATDPCGRSSGRIWCLHYSPLPSLVSNAKFSVFFLFLCFPPYSDISNPISVCRWWDKTMKKWEELFSYGGLKPHSFLLPLLFPGFGVRDHFLALLNTCLYGSKVLSFPAGVSYSWSKSNPWPSFFIHLSKPQAQLCEMLDWALLYLLLHFHLWSVSSALCSTLTEYVCTGKVPAKAKTTKRVSFGQLLQVCETGSLRMMDSAFPSGLHTSLEP